MNVYGIIGFPLTHSFSKQYFTDKIKNEGIAEAVYDSFPIKSIEEFPGLLKSFATLKGLSVTIPYKEKVLKYVTHLSPEVIEIGATNCIKVKGDELSAFNTDIVGFKESFVKRLGSGHTAALVLGTGGSSKAVQYVLQKLGIDFLIVSRTTGKKENSIQYDQVTPEVINKYKIIINCTPLGMSPDEATCPQIPYNILTKDHFLFDLVYNPSRTLFLQKGIEQGALICNGYEMLVIQAEANWKIWNSD